MVKLKKKNLQIAIDGPVASGKSIAAFKLAKKLKVLYVYTGVMYRAVAWLGLTHGLDLKKEAPLVRLLKKSKIKLRPATKKGRTIDVLVNHKDVTEQLFSPRVHWGSSQVAIFPKIRKRLVALAQEIASDKAVVMDGRDTTYRVLPKADLKIYLTADFRTRIKRRLEDLRKKGEKISLSALTGQIKKRDDQDSHRQHDPLRIIPDAWLLDTSNLTIKEEIEMILKKLEELNLIERK